MPLKQMSAINLNDHHRNAIEDDDEIVVISLIDFRLENTILINQLTDKMRNYRKRRIAFSMNFEEIAQIAPPQYDPFQDGLFLGARDIKISHAHNCICVADESLVLYNLETGEYIKSIIFEHEFPTCLFVEESDDRNQENDFIYCGDEQFTTKFNIKDLLESKDTSNVKEIWKVNQQNVLRMAMRRNRNNQKQIFRFNDSLIRMEVLDAIDGSITHFELEKVKSVPDIIFITDTKMMISDSQANKCFIFEETSENEWKIIKEIKKADNVEFSKPSGMTIDRVGKRIFLADFLNQRVIVFDYDGNVFSTFKSSSTKNQLYPFGLCFDDRTGLLYIANPVDICVRVFK